MLILTTKVDKPKLMLAAVAVIGAILLLLALPGGDSAPTAAMDHAADTNAARVKFLTDLGWEVTTSPAEASEVRIPREADEVFDRYNALQKSQGYDLTKYAGKKVMRYVYEVKNYPGATAPVYATVLVSKNEIIGGDITDTAAKGKIQGFQVAGSATTPSPAPSTAPSQSSESTAAAY